MLRIKLIKSVVGHNWRNRRTVQALGLRKIHQVVEQNDTPSIRGLIHAVRDLVTVEEVEGTVPPKAKRGVVAAPVTPETEPEAKPKKASRKKAAEGEE